jgi:hypothetical protein
MGRGGLRLCLRLQRGCGVRGWGRDGLGAGALGRGREGAEGFDVDYAPSIAAASGPRFDPSAVRAELAPALVARDDVVDAVACLVAARRIALGHAIALPAGRVERDRRGLRMEITA